MMKDGEIIAGVEMTGGKLYIKLDGGNSTKAKLALSSMEAAKKNMTFSSERYDLKTNIKYVYGASGLSTFDNFGSLLIGFIVFFFTFLISGISFLQERTTGTLEKLLSTPIKRWEIVTGYVLGFGVVSIIQSAIITFFVIFVLDILMVGSLWLVLLITFLSAMVALAFGILMSTAATSEFQMIAGLSKRPIII